MQICTRLSKGGPNNATYMSGFTYVLQGHQISAETNLQQPSSNDLLGMSCCRVPFLFASFLCYSEQCVLQNYAEQLSRGCAHIVTADGKTLAHDPQPNHQNFTFPGTPSVQLQWSLQGNNQLPSVSVTAGAHIAAPRLPAGLCIRLISSPCVTAACQGTAEH